MKMACRILTQIFSPPLKAGAFVLAVGLLVWSGPAPAAGPVYWDWPDGRTFAELERTGVALDQQGHLTRGLDTREIGPGGPEVFWTLADDGQGGVYLGSGHGGQIFQIDKNGDKVLLTALEGAEVFSILPRSDGTLLAGCGPDGQLYEVDKDNKATLLGEVTGGYIWAMAQHPAREEVWLATGSPAAIYRLDSQDRLELVHTLGAQNCLALKFLEDGSLLLGTQGPGLVYRLETDDLDNLQVVFQAPQEEVRQFITGPENRTYFLTLNTGDQENGPENGKNGKSGKNGDIPTSLMEFLDMGKQPAVEKAALFRLESDGKVTPYWASDVDLMIVAWSQSWGWLGGGPLDEKEGESTLHGLVAPAGHHPLASWSGGDVLDLLVTAGPDGQDRILAAEAHPGSVREIGRFSDGHPVAVSPPLDGRQRVDWGRLRWTAEGQTEGLRWSVRGGNRAEPDESWTDWTGAWTDSDQNLDLKPCRYLQWRVEFPHRQDSPRIASVSVSAWQENIRPVVRDFVLENISDISLGGMMNGGDNVTQTFRSGLKAEFSRNSRQDNRATGPRAAITRPVRVFTWQGKDPNGDRLIYKLEYLRQGDKAWRGIIDRTAETIGSWDTSEVPDGKYQVRLTASDEEDNPGGKSLSTSSRTGPILVDNTSPMIKGFTLKKQADGFRVVFEAQDSYSSLAGALIQLPDGSRQRLDPVDRICDSRKEKFDVKLAWPQADKPAGGSPWRVRVEVRDLAGNLAVAEGDVKSER